MYQSVPPPVLQWQWRLKALVEEIVFYMPDVVCMQEVDKFADLEERLRPFGYRGIWVKYVREMTHHIHKHLDSLGFIPCLYAAVCRS